MQVVLDEGLDISSLPDTLKEDFDQLDRLEGQYRVTNILTDMEDLSPGKGRPCSFCTAKEETEKKMYIVDTYKPKTTMAKVTLSDGFIT